MQFAPDGRLFVCEQGGKLRVIKNDVLLVTAFVTLTVDPTGERGLLGVAFDPGFATNHFVYVYYTATTPTIHNRISRFTANGDVAVAGSELQIFNLPTLNATNHNGGALGFGPDGKLYAAVGENAVSSNAQSLSTPLGKILRLNTDGTIPTDNPFYLSTTGTNRAIWALGLRNPFTFAFNPGGSELFINDVGESTWEEIDTGVAGANYGWPTTEGPTSNPNFTSPRYAYNHSSGGCAITGGAFYSPQTNQFPSDYFRDYFFADYCAGWIQKLDPAAGNSVVPFASGITAPVDLKVSEDGSLYYLARGATSTAGIVSRIRWTGGTVTADSVTPSSGSGPSQTFALKFSDTSGAANITTALVLFNAGMPTSSANSCLSYYNRSGNTLALLDVGDGRQQRITAEQPVHDHARHEHDGCDERDADDAQPGDDLQARLRRREERVHVCRGRRRDQQRTAVPRYMDSEHGRNRPDGRFGDPGIRKRRRADIRRAVFGYGWRDGYRRGLPLGQEHVFEQHRELLHRLPESPCQYLVVIEQWRHRLDDGGNRQRRNPAEQSMCHHDEHQHRGRERERPRAERGADVQVRVLRSQEPDSVRRQCRRHQQRMAGAGDVDGPLAIRTSAPRRHWRARS
jgi:glucose/arabinose dehydrogenase